jgi:hypothetical protein
LDPDPLVRGADPHRKRLRNPNTDIGDVKKFLILISLSPPQILCRVHAAIVRCAAAPLQQHGGDHHAAPSVNISRSAGHQAAHHPHTEAGRQDREGGGHSNLKKYFLKLDALLFYARRGDHAQLRMRTQRFLEVCAAKRA